jgi:hypothetical protein
MSSSSQLLWIRDIIRADGSSCLGLPFIVPHPGQSQVRRDDQRSTSTRIQVHSPDFDGMSSAHRCASLYRTLWIIYREAMATNNHPIITLLNTLNFDPLVVGSGYLLNAAGTAVLDNINTTYSNLYLADPTAIEELFPKTNYTGGKPSPIIINIPQTIELPLHNPLKFSPPIPLTSTVGHFTLVADLSRVPIQMHIPKNPTLRAPLITIRLLQDTINTALASTGAALIDFDFSKDIYQHRVNTNSQRKSTFKPLFTISLPNSDALDALFHDKPVRYLQVDAHRRLSIPIYPVSDTTYPPHRAINMKPLHDSNNPHHIHHSPLYPPCSRHAAKPTPSSQQWNSSQPPPHTTGTCPRGWQKLPKHIPIENTTMALHRHTCPQPYTPQHLSTDTMTHLYAQRILQKLDSPTDLHKNQKYPLHPENPILCNNDTLYPHLCNLHSFTGSYPISPCHVR